ncbi:MAG: beta-phosphoglucomutase [Phycisphaerae bacterium]
MTWTIHQGDLPYDNPDFLSTLFAVGNGASCTRGTGSEEGLDAFRGMYISGLYTRAGYGLVYFLSGPDWLHGQVRTGGKPAECTDASYALDLRRGLLTREATFRGAGTTVTLTETRLTALHDATLLAQRFTLQVDGDAEVSLAIGVDGDVRNHPAKYYKAGQLPNCTPEGLKLSEVASAEADTDGGQVTIVSPQVGKQVCVAYSTRQSQGAAAEASAEVVGGAARTVYTLSAGSGGKDFTFDKLCRFAADAEDGTVDAFDPSAARAELKSLAFRDVLDAHSAAWEAFWEEADVEIDGDERAQRAVRYALWATRIAAPRDAGLSSLGAKNLTGDWYRGAVFWDMEMFQLPLLAAVAPELSANHIRYRHRRLGSARMLARQDGYDGARFPWQSYFSGYEQPVCIGGFLYQQIHLNAAVAWGVLHHWDMTGDAGLMLEAGVEMLVELCRYWASRVERGEDGLFHIRHVCGPDEVHKDVDDNAYTNRMVKEVLRRTPTLISRLKTDRPAELDPLLQALNVAEEDLAAWADIADHLYFPTLPEQKVLAQFEGFENYAEPSFAARAEQSGSDKTNKQADTLLLFQTLGHSFWEGDLDRHYDAYAPLCTQTSSLSMCTHALLAARLGRQADAKRFFEAAAGVDLEDSYGNTCHGIHGAGQGGIWMAIVTGYGGLVTEPTHETEPARLRIAPNLPADWKNLHYRFRYHGCPLGVTVTAQNFTLENLGQQESRGIMVGRERVSLKPGESRTFGQVPRWRPRELQAVIFDLDGVLVKTDHFHYLAWKELADELGLAFDEEVNHQLRGVSRQESLRVIYRHNNAELPDKETFENLTTRKNEQYKKLVRGMTPEDVLPGSIELLEGLREAGIACALASASRNAPLVLERTGLGKYMDAVSDGSCVTKSKPDPQVFTVAAQRLRLLPWNCLGIEDAAAGIESIRRAGMVAVGIGDTADGADVTFGDVSQLSVEVLRRAFAEHENPLNPFQERNIAKMKAEQQK